MRPNCALDRRLILCLYVPGFQRQIFKHVKVLSERSKKKIEQKKNKGSILDAECAYNSQNTQFGLVMFVWPHLRKLVTLDLMCSNWTGVRVCCILSDRLVCFSALKGRAIHLDSRTYSAYLEKQKRKKLAVLLKVLMSN